MADLNFRLEAKKVKFEVDDAEDKCKRDCIDPALWYSSVKKMTRFDNAMEQCVSRSAREIGLGFELPEKAFPRDSYLR